MKKPWVFGLAVVALVTVAMILWRVFQPVLPPMGVLVTNGRIEGDQAVIGAKVAGKIVQLSVREGEQIEMGSLIAALAAEQVQAQFEQAEHVVHLAREELAASRTRVVSAQRQIEAAETAVTLAEQESRARIGEARAAVGAARAHLRQAEADHEKITKDYVRYQGLFAKQVISSQQLDAARTADEVARAAVQAARKHLVQSEKALQLAETSQVIVTLRQKEVETTRSHLAEARTGVEAARARLQTAEASRKLAQANLDDTQVLAPFAGTVLEKLVELGEVVSAGTPLITLVDLSRLHAKVYVDEAALGKIKTGNAARVYVDAFPNRYFTARVAQIAQQAEFTPRDIHMQDERVKLVFAVKLAIDNPEGILKPGMPVDARIQWDPAAPWGDGRA